MQQTLTYSSLVFRDFQVGCSLNIITFHFMQFISFPLNVLPSSSLSPSFDRMFLFWVKTGDHSSPVLIKHTLIVGQWQLQGKETREGDQLPWERWKKTEVEERVGGEGDRESSHCDGKHREDVKKLWWLKVSSPARWAEPPTWVIRRATPSSGRLTAPS